MKSGLLRRALVVGLLAGTLIAGSAVISAPANASWQGHFLVNVHTNTALDADRNHWYSNGSLVWLWSRNGNPNQQWWAEYDSDVWTTIRTPGAPQGPAKCLDAWPDPSVAGGYKVSTWDCHGGTQQNWRLERVSGVWETRRIRNQMFDLCLDTFWGSAPADGRHVGLWPCHGNVNQMWTVF